MTEYLQGCARAVLKEGLTQCTDAQRLAFKMVFLPRNLDASVDHVAALVDDTDLESAVSHMDKSFFTESQGK